ncbi:MAG: PEP-CTERM sorting domain-containing protein [Pirellulales bacterium]
MVNQTGTLSAGSNNAGDNGNGVGSMSIASSTWNTNASFVFDFARTDDGTTTSGITNWDYINITGAAGLNLAGASFTLSIRSWTDVLGTYGVNSANPFDPNTTSNTAATPEGSSFPANYRWLWVDNTGGGTISGISGDGELNQFVIDTSNLYAPTGPYVQPATSGHFWVSAYNNDLYINYSSVPEPGSLLFVGLAGLGFAAYRRRKRKAAQTNEENGTDVVSEEASQR